MAGGVGFRLGRVSLISGKITLLCKSWLEPKRFYVRSKNRMGICCQGWACLDIPGHFDAGYLGDGLGVLQQLQGASCRAQGEATSERWGCVIPNHQPGSVRRGTHFTVRGSHRVRSQIQSLCGSQGDQDVLLDGVGLDRLQGPGSSLAWACQPLPLPPPSSTDRRCHAPVPLPVSPVGAPRPFPLRVLGTALQAPAGSGGHLGLGSCQVDHR